MSASKRTFEIQLEPAQLAFKLDRQATRNLVLNAGRRGGWHKQLWWWLARFRNAESLQAVGELDKTKLKSKIGPSVIYIEMDELISTWRDIDKDDVGTVAGELMGKYKTEGPGEGDIQNSCRLGLAMEQVAEKYGLAGVSHLCQHLIHVQTGTTPCYAATRLIDKGVMVTCEGDIGNLVMMCLIHQLTGEPAVFVEWGMYDAKENAMLLVHHGAGSPKLAKSDSDVTITPTGEKWGFKGTGASFRYMGKPGPVTLASIIHDAEGWRMLITGGEVVDVPCRPYFGQQFMVKVDMPVQEYLAALCRKGVTHHAILSYGNLRPQLQQAANLLDMEQFLL